MLFILLTLRPTCSVDTKQKLLAQVIFLNVGFAFLPPQELK